MGSRYEYLGRFEIQGIIYRKYRDTVKNEIVYTEDII